MIKRNIKNSKKEGELNELSIALRMKKNREGLDKAVVQNTSYNVPAVKANDGVLKLRPD